MSPKQAQTSLSYLTTDFSLSMDCKILAIENSQSVACYNCLTNVVFSMYSGQHNLLPPMNTGCYSPALWGHNTLKNIYSYSELISVFHTIVQLSFYCCLTSS